MKIRAMGELLNGVPEIEHKLLLYSFEIERTQLAFEEVPSTLRKGHGAWHKA
jgi:hypothetical protein